jgi:hypothetical protein
VILLPVSSFFSSCLIATSTFGIGPPTVWCSVSASGRCELWLRVYWKSTPCQGARLFRSLMSRTLATQLPVAIHCPQCLSCPSQVYTRGMYTPSVVFKLFSRVLQGSTWLDSSWFALRLPAWPDNEFCETNMSRSSVMTSSLHSHTHYPLVNKHRPWKSPIFNGN